MTAPPEAELEALIARASVIAPRFRELAGIDAAVTALQAGGFDFPALRFDGTEFPRLDPAAAIPPIVDLDELIDVFSAILENPDATDDVERVLDGVSPSVRSAIRVDFDAHTRPLRKPAHAGLA